MIAISFGQSLWLVIVTLVYITYLLVLFHIVVDVFRDAALSGFAKAAWVLLLILFPLVTGIVYLVMRGSGMEQRSLGRARAARDEVDSYIRDVAGGGAATELTRASELRAQGAITDEEYAALKAKILA